MRVLTPIERPVCVCLCVCMHVFGLFVIQTFINDDCMFLDIPSKSTGRGDVCIDIRFQNHLFCVCRK